MVDQVEHLRKGQMPPCRFAVARHPTPLSRRRVELCRKVQISIPGRRGAWWTRGVMRSSGMVWVVLLAPGRNRACRSGKAYSGPMWYSTCETAAKHLSYLIPSQDMPAGIGWNGGTGKRKDPPGTGIRQA